MTKVALNDCFGGFSLSVAAHNWLIEHGVHKSYIDYYNFSSFRTDPLLIECIETLGKAANDSCAELVIVEFDENEFDYYVYEVQYGRETLHLIPKISRSRIASFVKNGDLNGLLEYLKFKNANLSH